MKKILSKRVDLIAMRDMGKPSTMNEPPMARNFTDWLESYWSKHGRMIKLHQERPDYSDAEVEAQAENIFHAITTELLENAKEYGKNYAAKTRKRFESAKLRNKNPRLRLSALVEEVFRIIQAGSGSPAEPSAARHDMSKSPKRRDSNPRGPVIAPGEPTGPGIYPQSH